MIEKVWRLIQVASSLGWRASAESSSYLRETPPSWRSPQCSLLMQRKGCTVFALHCVPEKENSDLGDHVGLPLFLDLRLSPHFPHTHHHAPRYICYSRGRGNWRKLSRIRPAILCSCGILRPGRDIHIDRWATGSCMCFLHFCSSWLLRGAYWWVLILYWRVKRVLREPTMTFGSHRFT